MSIENSIDRLAAAIEKLASAVSKPELTLHELDAATYAKAKEETRVEPRPATEQEKAEFEANPPPEVKKPRGRPRKQGNVEIISQEGVTVETQPLAVEDCALRPQPAAQTADTATEEVTATAAATGSIQTSATAPSTTTTAPTTSETTTGSVETISKGDIVQILTGLQKKLEESATTVEEKRGAAQKCRDLIKSVVGSESLKDAKPEHFGRIKSAVLKVLNND